MPNSIVKSFADKTGKTVQEVEKLWDGAKELAKKDGRKESDKDFYPYVTGILKNMLKLESVTDSVDEAMYRFTVYRVKHAPVKGKDTGTDFPIQTRLEFLEYLNQDEVDNWLTVNSHKYPSVIVVRSDGNWVLYDQPHGAKFKKVDSGKKFNTAYAGKYNKKADVTENTLPRFKEFLVYINESNTNIMIPGLNKTYFKTKEKIDVEFDWDGRGKGWIIYGSTNPKKQFYSIVLFSDDLGFVRIKSFKSEEDMKKDLYFLKSKSVIKIPDDTKNLKFNPI